MKLEDEGIAVQLAWPELFPVEDPATSPRCSQDTSKRREMDIAFN